MSQAEAPLTTVEHVDLDRYVGEWYEIARYPNRFEKDCASDVTAVYSPLKQGKIHVVNSCKERTGAIKESNGYAKISDPRSNAKLKVTFFRPFQGNYWIIDLDPDYRYAVVSEPKREYLWILSRTPRMDATLYDDLIHRVASNGYDTALIKKTLQPPGR